MWRSFAGRWMRKIECVNFLISNIWNVAEGAPRRYHKSPYVAWASVSLETRANAKFSNLWNKSRFDVLVSRSSDLVFTAITLLTPLPLFTYLPLLITTSHTLSFITRIDLRTLFVYKQIHIWISLYRKLNVYLMSLTWKSACTYMQWVSMKINRFF